MPFFTNRWHNQENSTIHEINMAPCQAYGEIGVNFRSGASDVIESSGLYEDV